MSDQRVRQRLAAILAADAAGYSRLMAADERATVAALDAARAVFRVQIEANQGRVIDMAGDSVLAVFETATGAVSAGLSIQDALATPDDSIPENQRMRFRIGVHLGDVIEKTDGTVYGDGVNIAARLQGLAEPGGVTVSESIRTAVKGKVGASFVDQGEQTVKNIADKVRAFAVRTAGGAAATAARSVPTQTVAPPSIAILPFADLSQEKDQEYFCDGMADELITALMSLEGVRVASRTSAFQFKGVAEDVGEIGRRLKVNTVLEGSVRRAGSRLRVTVQLTDAAEGFQLWSARYDRALDDVFAVQEEIARAIVDKLKVEMSGKTAARIVPLVRHNIVAYNLLLQGRYAIRKLTKEGFENGMAYFRQAIELEPDYAEAHAAIAQGYVLSAMFSVASPQQVMPVVTEAVTRALAINPNLAEGQLALAWARHYCAWDWTGAEKAYRRAVELAPGDSWVRQCYSFFLTTRGRHDEAVAEAKHAIDLDPVTPFTSLALTEALTYARRFDEAIDHATRTIALEPAFSSMYFSLALAQAGKGRYADAVAALERGRPHAHGDAMLEGFLGWAYGMAGDPEKARVIARQLEARGATAYVTAWSIGVVYQGLGEMDEAMRWYRLDYAERGMVCCSYARAPHYDVARQDPRFRELIELIEMGGPEVTA